MLLRTYCRHIEYNENVCVDKWASVKLEYNYLITLHWKQRKGQRKVKFYITGGQIEVTALCKLCSIACMFLAAKAKHIPAKSSPISRILRQFSLYQFRKSFLLI